MMDTAIIAKILSLYKRHGWTARQVLMTAELQKNLVSAQDEPLNDVEKRVADIDAIWFSRSAGNGRETWELRLLDPTPFALLDVLDQNLDETERDKALTRIEAQMREFKSRKPSGH